MLEGHTGLGQGPGAVQSGKESVRLEWKQAESDRGGQRGKGPGQVGRQGHSKDPVYTGRFWADAPGRLNDGAI